MKQSRKLFVTVVWAIMLAGCMPQSIANQLTPPPLAEGMNAPFNDAAQALPENQAIQFDDGETDPDEEQVSYEELVASAEKQVGVFTVYHTTEDDGWYWEIPEALLGQDLFWYSELTKAPPHFMGIDIVAEAMVEFDRIGNRLVIYEMSSVLDKRGTEESETPINRSVAEAAQPAILFALPIVAESPDGAAVVEVGSLFSNDLPDFSLSSFFPEDGGFVGDPDRSFVRQIQAFPNNVAVTSLLTSSGDGGEQSLSLSVEVRHNLALLPTEPMTPRYFDPRVGYFTIEYNDFSGEQERDVVTRQLITRFRLTKKDPSASLSEPIQPIVFYVSREVPDQWRDYIKQGIEDWQPAFEAAGFENAILAQDAPSEAEDPNWNPADIRYSVIRWIAQAEANAIGPSTVDPRTGEILSSHVKMYADVVELIEQWYFVQASASDETARTLPLPAEIIGEGLRYITAHEVGHGLGLRHNHRASQAYTVAQLRDPEFTAQNGTVSSIMSYGRFNYVAQPEDGVTNFIPGLGVYDLFAIEWGYKPIADATTPEDEKVTLDQWAARQLEDPWLAFGGEDFPAEVDPTVLTENIGADRIEATQLGIRNLERVMGYMVEATTQPGEDFQLLAKTYSSVLGQRYTWLSSVIKLVGGVEETRTLAGRGDMQFQRVSSEQQRSAVQFILENLQPQPAFVPVEVLNQIKSTKVTLDFAAEQQHLLEELLTPQRYQQLVDGEILNPNDAYPVVAFITDVQAGLFSELQADEPEIAPLRRGLQRHYLKLLRNQLLDGQTDIINTDIRAAIRWNLTQLATELTITATTVTDLPTQVHLTDLEIEIDKILESELAASGTAVTE